MSDHFSNTITLTPEQCGVSSWVKPSKTAHIVLGPALSGPTIVCKFVSRLDLNIQKLAKDAFIEAFRPDNLYEDNEGNKDGEEEFGFIVDSDGIIVKTRGYGDRYQCYFTKDLNHIASLPYIECVIHTSDDWEQLSYFEKTLKWACELDECVKGVIFKNKVQLPK
jgi:hypothetical protein